jgi:hypothetical protein
MISTVIGIFAVIVLFIGSFLPKNETSSTAFCLLLLVAVIAFK